MNRISRFFSFWTSELSDDSSVYDLLWNIFSMISLSHFITRLLSYNRSQKYRFNNSFHFITILHLFFLIFIPSTTAIVYYKNHLIRNSPKSFHSTYERKFAYSEGKESDGFGRAVDIYKNYMLVGACFDDQYGYQAGSAHIFTLTNSKRGWEYDSELFVNDTREYDYYGWDVALAPGVAAVGAWQHDDGYVNNGAVYIYDHIRLKNQMIWNMTAKVVGINDHQHFGISLCFSKDGSYLLIGASGDSGEDNSGIGIVGAVYVATYRTESATWIIQTSIRPADVGPYDYYGISVATHNHVTVVGAYGQNTGTGDAAGAVYIYSNQNTDYSQWYIEAKLIPSDSQKEDFFGRSVAVYDRTVVVGADGDDDCGVSSGSAYVFRSLAGSKWTQIQKLLPPEDSPYDLFGGSVAIYGNILVIGADGDSNNAVRAGTVWYYKKSYGWTDDAPTDDDYGNYYEYWTREFELYASDRSSRDLFGSDVAIYEKSILIGAEVGDGYDYNSGACYVYTVPPHNIDELMTNGDETSTLRIIGMTVGMFIVTAILLILAKRYHLLDQVQDFRHHGISPPQVFSDSRDSYC